MIDANQYDWEKIWHSAMAEWQISSSKAFYESCLKKAFIANKETTSHGVEVTLGIPNYFFIEEIKRKKIDATIEETLNRVVGKQVKVEYIMASKPDTTDYTKDTPLFANLDTQSVDHDLFLHELQKYHIKPESNLENYAVASSNEMAYAAAKAVANRPGAAYNPLFLYGGVGVGKTHLMQGIAQEILKKNLSTRIIYCTGEEFTNAIIEAIQKKNTANFRSKYRTVKLLLIDDIQFIAGKNSVQEEFFHTFNAVTASGGQIIMTSDKPPKEIDSLEDRLRSRFEGGLTIDIGDPNFELRCAILMIKASQMNITLTIDVAQVIADYEADTRALVGKLVTLITTAEDRKTALTKEFALETLNKLPATKRQTQPLNPQKVISYVSDFFNQPTQAVLGTSRIKTLTLPRHIAMYILKEDLHLNYKVIGQTFSGRDHTSVLHAIKKVNQLIKTDRQIKQDLTQIRADLHILGGKV